MPAADVRFGPAGVTRTWTDANGNFVAGLQPANPDAQDLRASGGDFCGALSNQASAPSTLTNNFDPALLNGWGVRSSDWTLGASIQQQLTAAGLGRGRLQPPLVSRLHGERQPGPSQRRLAAVQHHGARRIRGCPAAAATRFRDSTTSIRPSSDRSTTSRPTRQQTGNW